jgi:hypothetical protein
VDAISAAVSKEFAEREKAKAAKNTTAKPEGKVAEDRSSLTFSIVIPDGARKSGLRFFGPAAPIVTS